MATLQDSMICWTPKTDQVAIVPWPDTAGLNRYYRYTDGACFTAVHKMDFEQRKFLAYVTAIHMIIRDHCDPQAVHKAMLKLEEYRDGCADDMPGILDYRSIAEGQP